MKPVVRRIWERTFLSESEPWDFVWIPELELVFCFISKNASSFLKSYLSNLSKNQAWSYPARNPHMLKNSGFVAPSEIGNERFADLLQSPSVLKAVVGRDPIERLVSAYHSRVETWNRESYDPPWNSNWLRIRQRVLGQKLAAHASPWESALTEEIKWPDLVEYVLATPSGALDRHLVPQSWFACADFISYDLIGMVEDMPNFLSRLCVLVGRNPLEVEGVRLNESAENRENQTVVSVAQKTLLKKRYRADYEFLGIAED